MLHSAFAGARLYPLILSVSPYVNDLDVVDHLHVINCELAAFVQTHPRPKRKQRNPEPATTWFFWARLCVFCMVVLTARVKRCVENAIKLLRAERLLPALPTPRAR